MKLSQREFEVYLLIVEGLSNLQASKQLGVGEKTIKYHKSNIFKKLDVKSNAEAMVKFYTIEMDKLKADILTLQSQIDTLKSQSISHFVTNTTIPRLPGRDLL